MTRTLTDEQWEVIRDYAEEHARITETLACKDCTAENGHPGCKEAMAEADAIRRVIAAVEQEG